jgi:hypothetical protein
VSVTAELTNAHYRAQLAIKAHAIRTSQSIWSTWDGQQGTWARLLDLSTPVLKTLHQVSGQTARQYYTQLAAHATGTHDPALPVPELPEEQIARSLTSTGLVGTFVAHSKGKSEQAAMQIGFVKFAGSFSRLALVGSRDLLMATADHEESRATGWQRVTDGDPCDYCADSSNSGFHDHCACTIEPLFT